MKLILILLFQYLQDMFALFPSNGLALQYVLQWNCMGALLEVKLIKWMFRIAVIYIDIFYFIECPNFNVNNDKILNRVTTSLNDSRLFNTTHHWCADDNTPQNISLNFTELVYLTRIRVRGTSIRFRILVNENKTVYSDINGVDVSSY